VNPPVIVVGAGVIGCAVARELSARGIGALVVDDRLPGGGATQASAGMLAPYIEGHEGGLLRDLGVRSLNLYDNWIAAVRHESGMEVEYRRLGTLEVALDPDHGAELQRSAGVDPVARVWLDPAAARRQHPALGSIAGALSTPTHGYVAAPQLTRALVGAAEAQGVAFTRARVVRIRRAGGALEVETPDGMIRGQTVVLAAGAWINEIDVEGSRLPPLKPWRGQLLHLDWHGHHAIDTIVWGPECYIVPRVDGSLLVGATVEDVGFDERATAAGIRDLLDAACELLPEGWGATFRGVRVGLRPATPDELPVIGPDHAVEGLVHASGHFRNGVLLAPITATLIADWIEKQARDPVFDVLRADRFRSDQE
jgi:glycine oxidase ThiO